MIPINIAEKYKEIDYPYKMKEDLIKSLLLDYEVIEHTNKEIDYDYLEENDVTLEVINPNNDINLFVELSSEFTLYYSDYHVHYFSYEDEYETLNNDIKNIIEDKYGAASFYVDNKWLASYLEKDEISFLTNPWDLVKKMDLPKEHLQTIHDKGVIIKVDYWNRGHCLEFEIKKDLEVSEISHPRQYNVRFVVKDGYPYGSGSVHKYDDEKAYIKYALVTDIEDSEELTKELIEVLEDDAKRFGASKIFANVGSPINKPFVDLGYVEVDKIYDERIRRIDGVKVIFEKTVMKHL
ncbi:MAG: hypothetical protein LUG12_09680 [Erysipelotrichaceae bacterium]|nr:hypothetical protein [Erysipelotrichaceae bacterium]